jgi:hypothetical protein
MEIVQVTLKEGVNTDPEKLNRALDEVQTVGGFATLDTRYASRLGVISGQLPEERISDLEKLEVVSALQRNEPMNGLD